MAKNILTLTSQEAIDFLMKSEQYHSFELQEYFTSDKENAGQLNNMLSDINKRIEEMYFSGLSIPITS